MRREFDAVTVGRRIKQARNAKGWSQEKLAEMIDTSTQQISKFENNGVQSMEWIARIENALDMDLLTDTIDVDGPIGEIGKEILMRLICNEGHIETKDLFDEFYGLSKNQITNEIVKLAKIGLLYREEINDWDNNNYNYLFISAKGLITLKNIELNNVQAEMLNDSMDSVITYEQLIKGFISYQDFIDNNEAEKLIRQINTNSIYDYFINYVEEDEDDEEDSIDPFFYMMNYIKFLKENYLYGFEKDAMLEILNDEFDILIPSVSCYHDILYRMALGISNKIIEEYSLSQRYKWELKSLLERKHNWDQEKSNTIRYFEMEFDWIDEEEYKQYQIQKIQDNNLAIMRNLYNDIFEKNGFKIDFSKMSLEEIENAVNSNSIPNFEFDSEDFEGYDEFKNSLLRENELLGIINNISMFDNDLKSIYFANRPEGKSPYPVDWFSKDEIIAFVEENYKGPLNKYEKKVLKIINRINDLIPSSLSYFEFPEEWESNGLASFIRDRMGVEEQYIKWNEGLYVTQDSDDMPF